MPSWLSVPVSGAFGRRVGCGGHFGEGQRIEQPATAVHHADVRAVELVGRAGEKVAADRLHVDELVVGEVDGVDEQKRADTSWRARQRGPCR